MSTQRIVFAVLGATLYLSAAAFGNDSTEESSSSFPDFASEPEYAESVAVFPDQPIAIYSGNSMTLRMLNQYENLTNCTVTLPSGELFDTLNDEAEDMSSFDQCGVLVYEVNENHTGTWQLDATIGGVVNYNGTFSVQVLVRESILTESVVLRVERGTSVQVTVGPSLATSCRLRNPLSENFPLLMGNCELDIASANEAHEGVWTMSYSLAGGVTLFEEKFEIIIYDEMPFNATVTRSDNGQIHLLCRVRAASASLCQFVTPYSKILDMVDGVGNDRYIHYGNGLKSYSANVSQDHECGLTILKPESADYGSWKCIVGTDSGLTGSILKVSARDNSEYIYLKPDKYEVYVTKGNSFELKCNVNAPLRYCWMRSPTGKIYTVSTNGNSSTALPYFGMGFSLGECGVVIPTSEDAHEGDWQCRVGLSDERELSTEIRVTVSDTVLVPSPRTVTPSRSQTYLSCYVPHEFGHSIDYCLWIRPNGALLENRGNQRYTMRETSSSCYLTIRRLQESDDVGEWTCMAGLVGSFDNVLASIEVLANVTEDQSQEGTKTQRSNTFFFFMLMAFSISATSLAILLAGLLRAKFMSKKNNFDSPPAYSESNVGLPTQVRPNPRR